MFINGLLLAVAVAAAMFASSSSSSSYHLPANASAIASHLCISEFFLMIFFNIFYEYICIVVVFVVV